MDDERLKQIQHFGIDYFEEMLERIREIRMSERRLYQKITDIYALSADYDTQSDITKHFLRLFKTNYIGQLPEKLLPKSFIPKRMLLKFIWV